MSSSAPARSVVDAYADDVVGGRLVTGELVRLAAERHLRDREQAHERGLWFDEAAAEKAVAFFGFLTQSKGEWAGRPLSLEPWQAFIVGALFGWKRADGMRRFRRAYVSVARKNGKTTLAAGLGLLLAFFDGEPGAEVYAAATKRDQAKICWEEAQRMVQRTPALSQRVTSLAHNLHIARTASKFEPLSADYNSLDGLNPHGALIDEYHAHPNGNLADVLESGTGARRQPLLLYTTTAGIDNESACRDLDIDCQRVLEGLADDDELFAYIARIDREDAWADPDVWIKANPNLGVSVKLESIEAACARARRLPREQNEFRRKRCNEWTEQAERWLDLDVWDACGAAVDETALVGRPCYAGLDLSTTTDLSALALVVPDETGGYDVVTRFWCPAERIHERSQRDRVPYAAWVAQGLLRATEGNVVDYDRIREDIRELAERYAIRELAFDRWNATQLVTQLQEDGANCVPFGQGFASLSAPTKELERLLLDGSLRHGNHPILRWMAANVAVEQDAAGNLKPSKRRSTERIDGVVALIMALGRAMVALPEQPVLALWDWDEPT